jgi:hypothetical protein
MDNIKNIVIESTPRTIKKSNKEPPKKRVITHTNQWIINDSDCSQEKQMEYLHEISSKTIQNNGQCSLLIQNINQKIQGYKQQDIAKKKYNEELFITFDYVVDLIINSNTLCYYCKQPVKLFYENVREPKQWSLDRIENDNGHNKENIFITCLSCNLKRRTMYHERFAFTKQLKITKI